REMLIGLHQSGVRPEELCGVTAADFHPEKGVWNVRGKTGERPVGLTQQLTELCRKLAERHPTGPLFRNAKGGAWRPQTVAETIRRLRKWLKKEGKAVPDSAFPYAFRHSYATGLLLQGVDQVRVAKQMGHSPAMLHKHYTH